MGGNAESAIVETFKGHTRSVLCLQVSKPSELLSAGEDCKVREWDLINKTSNILSVQPSYVTSFVKFEYGLLTNCQGTVGFLQPNFVKPQLLSSPKSGPYVTSIELEEEYRWVTCGSSDGNINVWNFFSK